MSVVSDSFPIELPPLRHPAVEQFKLVVMERAAHLRIAAMRIEQLVTLMPDDDALFEHAANDFPKASFILRDTLDRYRLLRDIRGLS